MRRLVGGIAVAVLVLAVAVTPLSATFQPGYFDLRYIDLNGDVVMGTLVDSTGLVYAARFDEGTTRAATGMTSTLLVRWTGGCDAPSMSMTFDAVPHGYRFRVVHTSGTACELLSLRGHGLVMGLRAPIDASTVEIVSV